MSNLTSEENLILKALVDPDTQEKQETYPDDKPIQQEFLCMMIRDKYFMNQAFGLIKPEYFEDISHQRICKIVCDFFEKNHRCVMPTRAHIENELKAEIGHHPSLMGYLAELESVINGYDPDLLPRETLIEKITDFARQQAIKNAVHKIIPLIKKRDPERWNHIEEILKKALMISPNTDIGLDYFETIEERYKRALAEDSKTDRFSSGFSSIDASIIGGGLSRGELGSFMGLPGSGKSRCLVKAAKTNLAHGKRVLFVSLEMDQDKIAERFDALLSRVPIGLLLDAPSKVIELVRGFKRSFVNKQNESLLFIKQFPAGSADVNTIRAYMSRLALDGFRPDLVCIDYIGEFKVIGNKRYESLQRIATELRGLAVEEQICILTAMQSNRKGREVQEQDGYVDDSEIADAFGQARPMDAIWSINATKQEQNAGVGHIFVVKHRHGKSRFSFKFKQDEETLDFYEISRDKYMAIMSTANSIAIKKAKPNTLETNLGSVDPEGE